MVGAEESGSQLIAHCSCCNKLRIVSSPTGIDGRLENASRGDASGSLATSNFPDLGNDAVCGGDGNVPNSCFEFVAAVLAKAEFRESGRLEGLMVAFGS